MLTRVNTRLVYSCWHGCYCYMVLAQGNCYANWDKNPLQKSQNRIRTRLGPGQTRTDQTWPDQDQLCWLVLQWISHYWPVSPVHSSGSVGFHLKCPLSGTDHHIRFFNKIKNDLFFFPLLHLPWSWLLNSQTLDSCGQAPAWQLQQAAVFSVRPSQPVFSLVTIPNVRSIFLMFFGFIKYVRSALQFIIII